MRKRSGRWGYLSVAALWGGVTLGLALWLAGAVQAIVAPDVYRAKQGILLPFDIVFAIALRGVALATLSGLGYSAVVWALNRARALPTDRLLVLGRMVHDPRRQLPATVTLGPDKVVHHLPPGHETEQVALSLAVGAASGSASRREGAITAPATGSVARPVPWPQTIPLFRLLADRPSINALVLGVDDNGEVVRERLSRMVHIAIGGSSGWGKSVFARALAFQLALAQERPRLILADIEGVTMAPFAGSDALMYEVLENEEQILAALHELNGELTRRREMFKAVGAGVDSLDAYNAQTDERLPPVVLVVDEATALLADNKDMYDALRPVVLRGRKFGLWVVLIGQDWKARTLDTTVRNQLATRVQFKALDSTQSRVLLGRDDAAGIEQPGEAYAILPGRPLVHFKSPWVSGEEIERILRSGARPPVIDVSPLRGTQDKREERVRELLRQGLSLSEVARRVYGSSGGSAFYKVKEIHAAMVGSAAEPPVD